MDKKMLSALSQKFHLRYRDLEQSSKKHNISYFDWIHPYAYLRKEQMGLEKGTVFFIERGMGMVRGYPKIQRAMLLKPTIKKFLKGKLIAEEKYNGYNVRVVGNKGEIISFTRGGLVCPYTNHRIKKEINPDFFKDHPDKVIFGEVIGKENPYVQIEYPEARKFAYFIFDIRERESNKPLNCQKRRELVEEYGMKNVPLIGYYSTKEGRKILNEVEKLEKEGREGLVIKEVNSGRALKYTTIASSLSDLYTAFSFPFDFGSDFIFRRLVRVAFRKAETGRGSSCSEIDQDIFAPLTECIKDVKRSGKHSLKFELPFDSEELFEDFLEFMKKNKIDLEYRPKNSKIVFFRNYPANSAKIRSYIKGETWTD